VHYGVKRNVYNENDANHHERSCRQVEPFWILSLQQNWNRVRESLI
jgi:hypothetical protein